MNDQAHSRIEPPLQFLDPSLKRICPQAIEQAVSSARNIGKFGMSDFLML